MKSLFYIRENSRIKEKNYLYFIHIGVVWGLFLINGCIQRQSSSPDSVMYGLFYFFGSLSLMLALYEQLFFVRELGARSSRLKKYAAVPLSLGSCLRSCGWIMARYQLILTAGCLVLYFGLPVLFTKKLSSMPDLTEGILFLLMGSAVYFCLFLSGALHSGVKE